MIVFRRLRLYFTPSINEVAYWDFHGNEAPTLFQQKKIIMTKHVLTFGAIGGAIVLVFMLVSQSLLVGADGKPDFGLMETLGYVSMIVALSMIYFGTKSYRDQHLSGVISFGQALKTGLLITLVASTFYVVGWMIYYHTSETAGQFTQQYTEYALDKLAESGASPAEIQQAETKYAEIAEMYKNPLIMAGVTLLEIFPVGLIISLLSSFILKNKTQ